MTQNSIIRSTYLGYLKKRKQHQDGQIPEDELYQCIDDMKAKFLKLVQGNPEFAGLSRESILCLIRVQTSFTFIPRHHFGLHIKPWGLEVER